MPQRWIESDAQKERADSGIVSDEVELSRLRHFLLASKIGLGTVERQENALNTVAHWFQGLHEPIIIDRQVCNMQEDRWIEGNLWLEVW